MRFVHLRNDDLIKRITGVILSFSGVDVQLLNWVVSGTPGQRRQKEEESLRAGSSGTGRISSGETRICMGVAQHERPADKRRHPAHY